MTPRSGLPYVFAGAVLLSFAPVFVKLTSVGPNAAGFYRMAFGGMVLAGIVALRRPHLGGDRPAWGMAVLAGFLFATDLILWHQSIHDVGPGLSTILANFQVFILAAVGVLVFKERAGWRLPVAIGLAITGLFLLVGVTGPDSRPATGGASCWDSSRRLPTRRTSWSYARVREARLVSTPWRTWSSSVRWPRP